MLEESLPFTAERDIPAFAGSGRRVRSRLHFARGHWNAGVLEDAAYVLDGDGNAVGRSLAAGDRADPVAPRHAGRPVRTVRDRLATGRSHRRAGAPAVRAGRVAERMWMAERSDDRSPRCPISTWPGTPRSRTSWALGDLAVWLDRLGLGHGPAACKLSRSGWHSTVVTTGPPGWTARASPMPRRWPGRTHRTRRIDTRRGAARRLGAAGTADRMRAALRRDGIAQVPPRPRISTRSNPAGLTNRQLDVAKLVARGSAPTPRSRPGCSSRRRPPITTCPRYSPSSVWPAGEPWYCRRTSSAWVEPPRRRPLSVSRASSRDLNPPVRLRPRPGLQPPIDLVRVERTAPCAGQPQEEPGGPPVAPVARPGFDDDPAQPVGGISTASIR